MATHRDGQPVRIALIGSGRMGAFHGHLVARLVPDAHPVAVADLVVAAAGAGKHIFCEKPMALTLADADRAIDAAPPAEVVLQVGFNRRFAADWQAARA